MTTEMGEPVPAVLDPGLTSHTPRWRKWSVQVLVSTITLLSLMYGLNWWSNRLTSEEEAVAGRWVAIDSYTVTSPKVSETSTILRKLELKSGHEVSLKIWATGNAPRISLFGVRGCLFPQQITSRFSVVEAHHPMKIDESADRTSPTGIATGRWRAAEGEIQIDWESKKSLTQITHESWNRYVHGLTTVSIEFQAVGTVARHGDDQMTIQWGTGSHRLSSTHFHDPQVWSRRAE